MDGDRQHLGAILETGFQRIDEDRMAARPSSGGRPRIRSPSGWSRRSPGPQRARPARLALGQVDLPVMAAGRQVETGIARLAASSTLPCRSAAGRPGCRQSPSFLLILAQRIGGEQFAQRVPDHRQRQADGNQGSETAGGAAARSCLAVRNGVSRSRGGSRWRPNRSSCADGPTIASMAFLAWSYRGPGHGWQDRAGRRPGPCGRQDR